MSALRRVVTCGRGHRSGSVVRWKRRLAFHAPAAKWPYRPAQCFSSTFEPFLLDLVISLVSIFLTISSLRNSTLLFLLLCEIQQSQGVISFLFSARRRDTRTFLRSWAEVESWERRHCAGAECCATSRFRSRARVHAMIP